MLRTRLKDMFKLSAILAMTLALANCASPELRAAVAAKGAEASDQALETVMWQLCYAMPVGAVKRAFRTPEERSAYNAVCPDELP